MMTDSGPTLTATPADTRPGEFRLSPEDDNFHPPKTDGRWEHETAWMWFFIPERKIGAWIYHYVRPNIGVSGGANDSAAKQSMEDLKGYVRRHLLGG